MIEYSLNGTWEYRIGYGAWGTREVPFSALAVGHSECRLRFDLPDGGERTLLRFDGITYAATVHLNGKTLGEMYPYCEYLFDITDCVLPQDNTLLVELEDLSPAFGPSAGWENYGGIIRPVTLLIGARERIASCFFHAELAEDFSSAAYTVDVACEEADGCRVLVTLSDADDRTVDRFCFSVGEEAPVRRLESPLLWSPDHPNLYRLSVSLMRKENRLDGYETAVGFRSFTCDRHRFYLNGEPIFLLGVCRHEMIGSSGHCPTREDVRQELCRIKDAGCNFVRLVHYPHAKETLEIAAEIGLMVSEEPGLWGSDTADPELARGSLEVLRRTVLRDRNSPSIVFWLAFNECRFSEGYLRAARKTVLACDKTRMISGANDRGDAETLEFFNLCEFDFYTSHPYAPTFERARNSARALHDKPLVFTEWGGFFVYDNPPLLADFIREMANLYKNPSDDGALAGAFFWFWREVYDFNRGAPACHDGILSEALVDYNGTPTPIYSTYFNTWKAALGLAEEKEKYEYIPLAPLGGTRLAPQGEDGFEELFAKMRESIDVLRGPLMHNEWRRRTFWFGPRLKEGTDASIWATPCVVKPKNPLVFLGRAEGEELTLVGLSGALCGYPLGGEYGEEVARVTVFYENGKAEQFSLRNGYEVTTVYTTVGSSRINPQAAHATPFAYFSYDKNHENYIINRLALPLAERSAVTRVEIAAGERDYGLLIFGVFVE